MIFLHQTPKLGGWKQYMFTIPQMLWMGKENAHSQVTSSRSNPCHHWNGDSFCHTEGLTESRAASNSFKPGTSRSSRMLGLKQFHSHWLSVTPGSSPHRLLNIFKLGRHPQESTSRTEARVCSNLIMEVTSCPPILKWMKSHKSLGLGTISEVSYLLVDLVIPICKMGPSQAVLYTTPPNGKII